MMEKPNILWCEMVEDVDETIRNGSEVSNDVSDVQHSSSESSDESALLETVSERGSDTDVPSSTLYSSIAKKNLPAEEPHEEVTYRPSYLSEFEKEHFNRENVMPDRPYTAFFNAPSTAFTTKEIFDALLSDSIPASAVRCLQRSPNGRVLITFASQKYLNQFL